MTTTMKDVARIWIGVILIGLAYGISHDLITAHAWTPYFTVHHPYFGVDSPILLAFIWGVIATWPSLIAGGLIAGAALGFRLPKLEPNLTLRRTAILSAVCWVISLAWIPGIWIFTRRVELTDRPADWDERSIAIGVGMAHASSYTTTAIAVLILILWILASRKKLERTQRDG